MVSGAQHPGTVAPLSLLGAPGPLPVSSFKEASGWYLGPSQLSSERPAGLLPQEDPVLTPNCEFPAIPLKHSPLSVLAFLFVSCPSRRSLNCGAGEDS